MTRGTAPLLLLLAGCVESLPPIEETVSDPLEAGEARSVILESVRLDVRRFEERIDLERLQQVPRAVLDRVWLLDLDLVPLVDNALGLLRDTPERDARTLSTAARNMRRLLRTTPDNVTLTGTSIDEMVDVAAAIGIPPAVALADLLEIDPVDRVLSPEVVTQVVVERVLSTHPATWTRPGPVDDSHPDGRWDVAPDSLPVTLGDVVSGFDGLAERFGPVTRPDGSIHPGVIDAAEARATDVLGPDFAMTIKVDGNALPWRGVDLTDASPAAITSTRSQIDTLFATDEPDWVRLEGLVPSPRIRSLAMRVTESDLFHPAGTTRQPTPRGASTLWDLPPWTFEHVVGEAAFRVMRSISEHCVRYDLATGLQAFEGCVDPTGWITFTTFDSLGSPPPPLYIWELMAEIAQVRLHDDGLEEGEADVAFELEDVPLGITADELSAVVAANLALDPTVLEELAGVLTDNARGAADFVYVREGDADTLWFVTPEDVSLTPEGDPVRPFSYSSVGFFADEELSEKVSTPRPGTGHEQVAIESNDTLFASDDDGRVYRLDVGPKPGVHRIALEVTRIR